jgi:type I restriction-modification system DNA methylase subunit
MAAPKELRVLVEQFERNEEIYRAQQFNEAAVRVQFINPLFELLGWDVTNRAGHAEAYKDVVHEDALRVGVHIKAPDYAFRVGGTRKFFVEAKRPSAQLKDNADAAFQLRRYAWSAKLPISVLCNFAELAVYDCRDRPSRTDKVATARIKYYTFKEYVEKWDEIYEVFSKEGIYKGSFDKYAVTSKSKRGTAEVDDVFLDEMESWRAGLARNLAFRNELSEREVNAAVQQTIDRIVFLRIAEDRGLEPYGRLRALSKGSEIYPKLVDVFKDADDRYNSGLFHFKKDSARPHAPDELGPRLVLDDKPLKEILSNLYYPESPYEFSVIPADILGQVYERFLGKVIRLSDGGRASIEEKPEVRKAGGVYYTPTHIVSYIVSQTIEPLLKGRTPKQISELRIVDPACGSGSFLLGAYEFLMRWYLTEYVREGAEKHARGRPPRLFQDVHGDWQLTTTERKRILLAHIFGVDIDPQAVEVTKLSLLLKVLEGESAEALGKSLQMFHERALPDLEENIKCGNSLVGKDFFHNHPGAQQEMRYQINAFDWSHEFPAVFDDGGFDAVIGNPPYVDSEWMTKTNPELRQYCNTHYDAASGNWDLFCVFVEKALRLCKPGGRSSMIVPNKLLSAHYADATRKYLSTAATLLSIRDYSSVKVFPVAVYPIVYVCANREPRKNDQVTYEVMTENTIAPKVSSSAELSLGSLGKAGDWSRVGQGSDGDLIEKLARQGQPLGTIALVNGAATVSEAYEIQPLITEWVRGSERHLRFVNTGTLDRYAILWGCNQTRYLKRSYTKPIVEESRWRKLPKKRMQEAQAEKIVIGGMTKVLECALDTGAYLAGKSTSLVLNCSYPLPYVLGILNSKVMSFFYRQRFSGLALQGGFFRIGPPQLRLLPIPSPRTSPSAAKKLQAQVGQIIELNEALLTAGGHERTVLERRIGQIDHEIDGTVYRLFALSPSEMRAIDDAMHQKSNRVNHLLPTSTQRR